MKSNKAILLVFIVLSVVGCKTPQSFTNTVVEYRDTTIYVELPPVYIDTIIEVPVPYKDTLRASKKLEVKDNKVNLKRKHIEKGIIGIDVVIKDNDATLEAYLLDSTILFNYRDTIIPEGYVKIENAIKDTKKETQVVLPPKRYIPKFFWFTFIIVMIEILAAIGFIVLKIKTAGLTTVIDKLKQKWQ